MKVQMEKVTPVKTKLTVTVEAAEFKREIKSALNKIRATVSIPGFRKGKAPMATVEKMYGDRARADAISEAIRKTYSQALDNNEIIPVCDADIEIQEVPDDGTVVYTAVVEVRPEVTATGYTGLELKREKVEIDATQIEVRIEELRKRAATFEPAEDDYAAVSGDMVVMNFVGKVDGELFEGGTAEDYPLVLGDGRMIPGFEDGIMGIKPNEERTIKVDFPDEYPAKDLAGKAASFEITSKEVKKRVLPEADDDFAMQATGVETLAELRKNLEEMLEAEQKNRIQSEFRNKLIDTLLAANPFEVPESLITRQKEHTTQRMTQDMVSRGMDPSSAGLESPEFAEEATRAAERSIRWAFLADALARAENIEITDEDIDARITEIANADGRPYTEIRKFFETEEHLDSLRSSLREQRTMDAVLATAKIEEVDAEQWVQWKGE